MQNEIYLFRWWFGEFIWKLVINEIYVNYIQCFQLIQSTMKRPIVQAYNTVQNALVNRSVVFCILAHNLWLLQIKIDIIAKSEILVHVLP